MTSPTLLEPETPKLVQPPPVSFGKFCRQKAHSLPAIPQLGTFPKQSSLLTGVHTGRVCENARFSMGPRCHHQESG